eukprot:scaffold16290_cov54-Phaeocystis_antarctica.AAC.5
MRDRHTEHGEAAYELLTRDHAVAAVVPALEDVAQPHPPVAQLATHPAGQQRGALPQHLVGRQLASVGARDDLLGLVIVLGDLQTAHAAERRAWDRGGRCHQRRRPPRERERRKSVGAGFVTGEKTRHAPKSL